MAAAKIIAIAVLLIIAANAFLYAALRRRIDAAKRASLAGQNPVDQLPDGRNETV